MEIDKFYHDIILENSKDKSNKKDIEDATDIERGHNPSCGDDISIIIKKDNKISDISYLGEGCAISTASANMMINLVKGKTIEEAKKIVDVFFEMIKNEKNIENIDVLGDAVVLHLTHNMPARIKCATLPWHALKILLEKC